MKKLRVTVDGRAFDVTVEILEEAGQAHPAAQAPAPVPLMATPAPAPTPVAAAPKAAPAAGGPGSIPSPLAGKVVSVDIKVGQRVEEGSQLLTIEAMKMNTYVYAPKGGTVAAVLVNPGDAVEEGQALVTLG